MIKRKDEWYSHRGEFRADHKHEDVSEAETLRRTATMPGVYWKTGTYTGMKMVPPRGEDMKIPSR